MIINWYRNLVLTISLLPLHTIMLFRDFFGYYNIIYINKGSISSHGIKHCLLKMLPKCVLCHI